MTGGTMPERRTTGHVQSKGRASLKGLSMAAAEAAPDVKCAEDGDLGSPASAALPKGETPSCSRQCSCEQQLRKEKRDSLVMGQADPTAQGSYQAV